MKKLVCYKCGLENNLVVTDNSDDEYMARRVLEEIRSKSTGKEPAILDTFLESDFSREGAERKRNEKIKDIAAQYATDSCKGEKSPIGDAIIFRHYCGLPIRLYIGARKNPQYVGSLVTCDGEVKGQILSDEEFEVASTIGEGAERQYKCPYCDNYTVICTRDDLKELDSIRANEIGVWEEPVLKSNLKRLTHKNNIKIEEYLSNLVEAETIAMTIKEYGKKLYKKRIGLEREVKSFEVTIDKDGILKSIQNEIQNYEFRIGQIKITISNIENGEIDDDEINNICRNEDIVCPIKPIEPKLPVMPEAPKLEIIDEKSIVIPSEPTYQKANIFNKKKIEKINQELKNQYEEAINRYNNQLAIVESNKKKTDEYNRKMAEYELLKVKYQSDYPLYHEKEKEYELLLEEYHKRMEKAIEKERKKRKKELPKLKKKEKSLEDEVQKLKEKMDGTNYLDLYMETNATYKSVRQKLLFVKDEMIETLLKYDEVNEYIVSLWNEGILFPKYNNYVAWSTMLEYFQSGRVNSLEGPDGAYNLYESELRSNIIIDKLDVIISDLYSIIDNQYILYTELVAIRNSTEELADAMDDVLNEVNEVETIEKTSNELLSKIDTKSSVIEYNTRKAAMYSKVAAIASVVAAL